MELPELGEELDNSESVIVGNSQARLKSQSRFMGRVSKKVLTQNDIRA